MSRRASWFGVFALPLISAAVAGAAGVPYPIVDTGQLRCFSDTAEISYPAPRTPKRPDNGGPRLIRSSGPWTNPGAGPAQRIWRTVPVGLRSTSVLARPLEPCGGCA